jgi:hypothetical protein
VTPKNLEDDEVKREKGGRKYNIVTREYMAEGHDGYLALKGNKYLIDEEQGQLMSGIVRKYLHIPRRLYVDEVWIPETIHRIALREEDGSSGRIA